MTTFAGPMAASDFGAATPSAFTLDHCWGLLGSDRYEIECALDGPDFEGEGTLWGGNLAMLAHLVGTPHLPRVDHGILFLEDIAEHPYRVERMLYQLHFAGILARQRAVLLGAFNGYELADNDNGYDAAAMVAHFPRDARHSSLHRASVRPRSREAHVARRRALRTDGEERAGAACALDYGVR
jgi:muramoyltetrapeptide carboxypeptidase